MNIGKKGPSGGKAEVISLIRPLDRKVSLLFLALLIVSVAAYIYLVVTETFSIFVSIQVFSAPFLAAGAVYYIVDRKFVFGIIVAIIAVAAFFLMPKIVMSILYLAVGSAGVAVMSDIIQRRSFYALLRRIEMINVKGKRDLKDRIIAFIFDIHPDLDSRCIEINRDYTRKQVSRDDAVRVMLMTLLLSMFVWMYVFMDPSVTIDTDGIPMFVFTVIMYLTVLTMPFSILGIMNARVETDYRNFGLISGIMETAKRMAVPMVIAVAIIFFDVMSIENLFFAVMSVVMTILMVIAVAFMHFSTCELPLVTDILENWTRFHPTGLYSGYSPYGRSSMDDEVPGTPRRDPKACFSTDIRTRSR